MRVCANTPCPREVLLSEIGYSSPISSSLFLFVAMAPFNPSLLSEMPEFDVTAAPGGTASTMGSPPAEVGVPVNALSNVLPLATPVRPSPLTAGAISESSTLDETFDILVFRRSFVTRCSL